MAITPAALSANPDGWCVPQRYVLAFMGFLAIANGYIQRFCLSLAITEMVLPHHVATTSAGPNFMDPNACPYEAVNRTGIGSTRVSSAEFDWSEETQGLILSAVFWGYVLTQLPGGLLAERYGGKHILSIGLLISTLGTLLTPTVARMGANWMIALRFCIGLGQGPMYPSLNVMLAQWAPKQERGRLGAAVFAGAQIGNVVSMALGGLLMRYVQGGWVNVFHVFGAAGLVWVAVWQVLCYSEPESHPFISDAEKQYLMSQSVGQLKRRQELPRPPWRHILTSVPLWGLIIAQIGHDWGLFTIITDLPKYMKSVMHFPIAQNGLLSAAPHLVMWIFAIISGAVVDYLVSRKVSITLVRKIFISIAATGPAVGILAASYSGCDKVLVASFFTAGMGLMGAFVPSLKVNALDLSPNYAGTLMALVGGVGAISGIITPYLVGLLTPNSTLLEWRLVFWIAVVVLVCTNVVYLFLGSGEVQPWNDLEPRKDGVISAKPTIIPKRPSTDYHAAETGVSKT